jgi:hypothetical protein
MYAHTPYRTAQVLLTVPALRDLMLMLLLVFVVFSLFAVSFFGDLVDPVSTALDAANSSVDAADFGPTLERGFGDGFHGFTNAFLSLFSLWSTDNYPRVCCPPPPRPSANAPLPLPPPRFQPHPQLLAGDRPHSACPRHELSGRRVRHLLLPYFHTRVCLHDHLGARRCSLRDL